MILMVASLMAFWSRSVRLLALATSILSRRFLKRVEGRYRLVALPRDLGELLAVVFPNDIQAVGMLLADLLQLFMDSVAMDPTLARVRQVR